MKKRVLSALCLLLVCVLLLAACGDDDKEGSSSGGQETYEGAYYLYEEGSGVDMEFCLRLSGGQWSMGEQELAGAYRISDGKLTLLYILRADNEYGADLIAAGAGRSGETVELFSGSIGGGKIVIDRTLRLVMPTEQVFYLDGKVPVGGNFGGNGGNGGNTGNTGNAGSGGDIARVRSSALFDYTFALDGAVYQLPCSQAAFTRNGWWFTYPNIEDMPLDAGEDYTLSMEKNGHRVYATIYNDGSAPKKLSECPVGSVRCEADSGVSFVISKGFTPDFSEADVREAFGTPEYDFDMTTYWYMEYTQVDYQSYVVFRVGLDGNASSIELQNYLPS